MKNRRRSTKLLGYGYILEYLNCNTNWFAFYGQENTSLALIGSNLSRLLIMWEGIEWEEARERERVRRVWAQRLGLHFLKVKPSTVCTLCRYQVHVL